MKKYKTSKKKKDKIEKVMEVDDAANEQDLVQSAMITVVGGTEDEKIKK